MLAKLFRASLPALSFLNLLDGILSFYYFRKFGIDIESNPVVLKLLQYDPSAYGFLMLKILFSLALIFFLFNTKKIPRWLRLLSLGGLIIYSLMFAEGILALLKKVL